jgi:glycosyltransferase involved in cell wall biosynthesis
MIPDPRVFWVKPASKKAFEIINDEKIDYIVTTGPPHSMHLIGRTIKRRLKDAIFWLADFRDPWSNWDILQKLNAGEKALEKHRMLERSVIHEADVSTTVSQRLAQDFGGIEVLYNGISLDSRQAESKSSNHFILGYFGMLNEIRNPGSLWKLLDNLCSSHVSFSEKFELRIGGIVAESVKEEILSYTSLKENVRFLDYMNHHEVLEQYKQCDVLLLLLSNTDDAKWNLPVKFFEYLTANRLILTLGPLESDLAEIVSGKDIGAIYDYNDSSEISDFLVAAFENHKRPRERDIKTLLNDFSHEQLVKKLIHLLNRSKS